MTRPVRTKLELLVNRKPDGEDAEPHEGYDHCDLDPARQAREVEEGRFFVGFGRNEGRRFELVLTEVCHG